MKHGKILTMTLFFLTLFFSTQIWGQDFFVTGSDPLLGNWNYTAGLLLKDDGVLPDEKAGDLIFSASCIFSIVEPYTIEYKVTDGTTWLGTSNGNNMLLMFPKTLAAYNQEVIFYFDRRDLGGEQFFPQIDYISDSYNANYAWVAVGDFQSEAGEVGDWLPYSEITMMYDDGTRGDLLADDGIRTFQFKPSASLPYAEWKAVRYGTWAGATKFGSNGWSYDPEDSWNGYWAAEPYDIVRLEFDAKYGHIRNTVMPAVSCDIACSNPKVKRGEKARLKIIMTNNNYETESFKAWIDLTLPNGKPYPKNPLLGPYSLKLNGKQAYQTDYNLQIPNNAPYGFPYTLTLKVGVYPEPVWSSDYVELEVIH